MYPTLLDTKTGKVVALQYVDNHEFSVFWWSQGNGSCDCNRSSRFGQEVVDELNAEFGEESCFGSNRFVAIDANGDLEGLTKDEVLDKLNCDYPESLKKFWKKQ